MRLSEGDKNGKRSKRQLWKLFMLANLYHQSS